MYNPSYGLQFPKPPIEKYHIAPLVRQSDDFSLTQPIQLQSHQSENQLTESSSSTLSAKALGKQRSD